MQEGRRLAPPSSLGKPRMGPLIVTPASAARRIGPIAAVAVGEARAAPATPAAAVARRIGVAARIAVGQAGAATPASVAGRIGIAACVAVGDARAAAAAAAPAARRIAVRAAVAVAAAVRRPPPQLRPRPGGSELGPLSLSEQPPPQLRPRPPGSLFGPLSLSLHWSAAAPSLTAVSAPPATIAPPATRPRKERRLNLRVGFIYISPRSPKRFFDPRQPRMGNGALGSGQTIGGRPLSRSCGAGTSFGRRKWEAPRRRAR